MVGLGGPEPPTSPLSVLRSFVSAVGLDNPKLMLWRELQQHGRGASKEQQVPSQTNAQAGMLWVDRVGDPSEFFCGKLGIRIQQTKNSPSFLTTCLKVVDARRNAVRTSD